MTAYNWKYDKPKPRGQKLIKSRHEQRVVQQMLSSFRVYFPTRKTVAESKGGLGVSPLLFLWLSPICTLGIRLLSSRCRTEL